MMIPFLCLVVFMKAAWNADDYAKPLSFESQDVELIYAGSDLRAGLPMVVLASAETTVAAQ